MPFTIPVLRASITVGTPTRATPPLGSFLSSISKGNPKVVLVRTVGSLECFEVCYSAELARLVKENPAQPIRATYRVSVRFGWPDWIETLETAGIPNLMGTGGQHGRGECF